MNEIIKQIDNGQIYSWGQGSSGALGHGDNLDRHAPKQIQAFSDKVKREKQKQNKHELTKTKQT